MSENSTLSFDILDCKPILLVISGPSGVGKDAVLQRMKERNLPFHFVVTTTSRPPRPSEVEGVDYFFISREKFEQMIAQDELVEYAVVYQDYKGIPRSQIADALASGKDVVVRVDVQGAERIRTLFPQCISVFLIPSNEEEWLLRLKNRKTETAEALKLRLATAREELKRINEFNYVVINADNRLEEAVDTISAIIRAEHHRVPPPQEQK